MRNSIIAVLLFVLPGTIRAQSPATVESAAVEPPDLKYELDGAELHYKLTLTSETTPGKPSRYEYYVIYKTDVRDLKSYSINTTINSLGGSGGYYERGIVKLGPADVRDRLAKATISDRGVAESVERPAWALSLPFDVGRLAFPELPLEKTKTLTIPVSFVNNRYPQYYRLISDARFIGNVRRVTDANSRVKADLKTVRTLDKQDQNTVTFKDEYELVGEKFQPEIQLKGRATTVYSIAQSSIDSIRHVMEFTWKEPNQSKTIPMTLTLKRFTDDERLAFEEKKRVASEKSKARMTERKAKENALPGLEETDRVKELVMTADRDTLSILFSKLSKESSKFKERSPEIARAIYDRSCKMARVDYSAKGLVAKLDPDLEKAINLAYEYNSSFGIALTGEVIQPNDKLQKGQLICIPYSSGSSSWKAATFYASTEDVLVVQKRESEPKLMVYRRKECRFPSDAFIDPVVADKK